MKITLYSRFLILLFGLFSIYSYAQTPTITSFAPSNGQIGTIITVSGTNLGSPTNLSIGGVSAIILSSTDTTVVGMVMPGASNSSIINVTNGNGTATSPTNFIVTSPAFSPIQKGNKLVGTGAIGAANQGYKSVISADGNTLAIGGYADDGGIGAVWVYVRKGGVWSQQGSKLVGTGAIGNANQGYGVSISADGNTIVETGILDNGGVGAAWVFTRSNGVWNQQGNKLIGSGEVGSSNQGKTCGISADGNTVVIGGNADDGGIGAAWVFTRSGGVWSQQGNKLVGTGAVGSAQQGSGVSISADGNIVASGGYNDDGGIGATWIFARIGGVWWQLGGKLVGSDNIGNSNQGISTTLNADGNTLAVGGIGDNGGIGATWVFSRSGSSFTQQGSKLVGTTAVGSSGQGAALSISADGNTLTSSGNLDDGGEGAVWVFMRSGVTWSQQGTKLKGTGSVGYANQGSGMALSADGNTLVLGGNLDDGGIGATWVFDHPSSDATLMELGLNNGVLSPTFSQIDTFYNTTVGSAITSITLYVRTTNNQATVAINGTPVIDSIVIPLVFGTNTIAAIVTAGDGTTTQIYNLTVYRINNVSTVQIQSNNSIAGLANIGNTVTLNFSTNSPIQSPSIIIAGKNASVTNLSGNNWQGTITVDNATRRGLVAFKIYATDLLGNVDSFATSTTDGSSIKILNRLNLAGFTGNQPASVAYSLRKLSSDYTGMVIQVERSSDNALLDIGFDARGLLDTTALLAFVGNNQGYVKTWYDQSGNGFNATNAVTNYLPQIINNGKLYRLNNIPQVYFRAFSVSAKFYIGAKCKDLGIADTDLEINSVVVPSDGHSRGFFGEENEISIFHLTTGFTTDNSFRIQSGSSTFNSIVSNGPNYNGSNLAIVDGRYNSGAITARKNGIDGTSKTTVNDLSKVNPPVFIGASGSTISAFLGFLSEFLIFPQTINDERLNLETNQTAYYLPPTLSPVHIQSNNSVPSHAKNGHAVTLSFTTNEGIFPPVVTILGKVVPVTNTTANNWQATLVVDSSMAEGLVPFSISSIVDTLNSTGVTVTNTTDGSSVTIDRIAPSIISASILSSNVISTHAKLGDTLIVILESDSPIQTPTVTIAGKNANVINLTDNIWKATVVVDNTTPQGNATLNIAYKDLANNVGIDVSNTMDGSVVTVDTIRPVISKVYINSNNADSTVANLGNIISFFFRVSEIVDVPVVTLAGKAAFVGSIDDTTWLAQIMVDSTVSIGQVAYNISCPDFAGNTNTSTPSTYNGSAVTIPAFSYVRIKSNNSITTVANTGQVITLSFNANKSIQTPTVTIAGKTITAVTTALNTWQAQLTVDSTVAEGLVSFTIDYVYLISGVAGTTVTTTSDLSTVTVDRGIPTISNVHIQSNSLTANAKQNDVITLSFVSSEPIKTPTITIGGLVATVSNTSGNSWQGTLSINRLVPEGLVTYSIVYRDLSDNVGTTVTQTTDNSFVTVDLLYNSFSRIGFTTNQEASAAYSLRRLSNDYNEYLIRVRRSNDSTLLDIGFDSNGVLDTVTLKNFVGTANGTVYIWYDQSGNGNDATQNSISREPFIIQNGALFKLNNTPSVRFISGARWLLMRDNFKVMGLGGSGMEINTVFANAAGTSGAIVALHDEIGLYRLRAGFPSSNSISYSLGTNAVVTSGTNVGINSYNIGGVRYYLGSFIARKDGVDGTPLVRANNSTQQGVVYIGRGFSPTAIVMQGRISEVLIFPAAINTDRAPLEANQYAYYYPPIISNVNIQSNYSNPAKATKGSTITVSFTANEALQTPNITISGATATVSNTSGNNWQGTLVVGNSTPQGIASINISYRDLIGNNGTVVTSTSNASSVTIDTMLSVATLSNLTISSGVLTPTFASGTISYTDTVSNATTSITVSPTTSQSPATITVNGAAVVSGTSSNSISLNPRSNSINIVVTAEDGVTTKTYTVNVYRLPSTNADLSNLTINAGTLQPAFTSGTISYTDTVSNATSTIALTPTASEGTATITINGTAVVSGTATGDLVLAVGSNTITTVVTAGDGVTTKTYTVNVYRLPSTNANLSNLTISNGTLQPTFVSGTISYTDTVSNATSTITITPTASEGTATITVNGSPVMSGAATGNLALAIGTNTINTVVTAGDGVTTKTYTVSVYRLPSTNADLSNLTISSGTLIPTFASGTISYIDTVSNATSTITLTPTASEGTATITVNGTAVTSGSASGSIALTVGINTITTVVTAGDGITTKTYTVVVTRQSTDATLSNLSLSSGTLSPTFVSGTISYTASVENATSSISITPTAANNQASIRVNGTIVASAAASGSIALSVGTNTITTIVTAGDGVTTKTYTVTVNRAASTNAKLSNIILSSGILSPVFDSLTQNYTATVGSATSSITLTPIADESTAVIKVNGTIVASGAASGSLALSVGTNTITTVVTAGDGITTKTYTVVITRQSLDASLSNLVLSIGNLNPVFASETMTYTASVSNATTSLTLTPTASNSNAIITVNGITVASGNASGSISLAVGLNTITTSVTAEDGITTLNYVVNLTRVDLPLISTSGTLASLTTTYGTASTSTSFNVSGTNMLAGIQINPPAGFELSTDNINYTNSVTIGTAGTITSTPIYIRLLSTDTVGNYSGNIVLTSVSATTVNVAMPLSTVTPREITVTAHSKTKVYGEVDPALTYTYTPALIGGDTFTGSLSRATGENIGKYIINKNTLALTNNYTITYVADSLSITAKTITVTAQAKTKVYGDVDPALTYTYTPALIGGDAFTGSLSRAVGENIGKYIINKNTLALTNNYTITYVADSLAITPKTITVTAQAKTKVYGDVDPALTYSYSPALIGADAFTGSLSRAVGENIGKYVINKNTLALNSNYVITYVADSLSITAKNISVTAQAKTKVYGEVDPALTYTYTPALNIGDSFTGSLSRATGENIGKYVIEKSTLTLTSNYTITYVADSLSITAKTITVTAQTKTKVYGEVDPALTYSYSPALIGADAFTGSLSRAVGENIGKYVINKNNLSLGSNYNITYVTDSLSITAKNITVTAEAKTKVYGEVDPALTYTYTPALIGTDVFTGSLSRSIGENIGKYIINQNTLALTSNYLITYVADSLSITAKNITVTAQAKIKVYGDVDPALTYTYTPALIGMDAFTGSLSRAVGENIGKYIISKNTLALTSNYTITYVADSLSITAKTITVTAQAKTKVYGEVDPTLTYTYSPGLIGADIFTGNLSRAIGENIGKYIINKNTLALTSNYTITYVADSLSITTKTITVTAEAKTKVYGDVDPTLTYSYTPALIGGDAFTGSLSRAVGENIGKYIINKNTLALTSNYTITYVADSLAITPKTITVTADAKTKVYGDVDPTFTYTYTPALIGGDAFTGSLSRAAGENIGKYIINQNTLALTNNYTITYVADSLSITAKNIIVTAQAKTKVYGEIDPTFTYTYTPALIGGDAFTGSLSRALGENIGKYIINKNTLELTNNYTITYVADSLSITTKNIIVTADAKTKVYGDVDPALTYTYTPGLISGDNFTGSLSRATGENIGKYVIEKNTLTLTSNYVITYVADSLSIAAKTITVTADAKTKVYGDVDPALTYTYTPALIGTDAFTGSLARATGENFGKYVIEKNTLTLTSNYIITYVADSLSITAKTITVTADAKTKVYGDVDPTLTYTYTPALIGTDVFTGNLSRAIGENIGKYIINKNTLSLGSNYTITYVADSLSITAKNIIVTADAKTKVYGDVDPTLTYTYTPALIGTDVFTGNLSRAIGENVGKYVINKNTLALTSNYTIIYVADSLSITAKNIIVTAQAKTKEYGETDPEFTYTFQPTIVGTDAFSGMLSRVEGENVGKYEIIQNTLSLSANYNIIYISDSLSITVKNIIVTALAKTKVYGEIDPELTFTFQPSIVGIDTFSGTLAREVGENVGKYEIIQNSLSLNENYSITYISDSLNISFKNITVTADAKTKVYGDVDPMPTYTYSPALIGADEFTGSLSRKSGEDIGKYEITQGTLELNSNYAIIYVEDSLTINARIITVNAQPNSKTYGEIDPVLTYTYAPALIGADVFAGSLSRTFGDTVGTYEIQKGSLSLNTNYEIIYESDTFTIYKKVITVTAEDQEKFFGEVDPIFTYTYSPDLLPGESFKGMLGRALGEDAGEYTINQGTLELNANYEMIFTEGLFTIKRLNDVTLSNLSLGIGTLNPVFEKHTFTYVAEVPSKTTSISLIPIASEETSVITVNGIPVISGTSTGNIDLLEGINIISVVVTSKDGVSSNTYSITVNPVNIEPNNTLTPNGDGVNDVWILKNIEEYPENKVTVYDRKGRVVYKKVGYKNDWGGTLNDKILEEETYYYFIELGTNYKPIKGYITLIQ